LCIYKDVDDANIWYRNVIDGLKPKVGPAVLIDSDHQPQPRSPNLGMSDVPSHPIFMVRSKQRRPQSHSANPAEPSEGVELLPRSLRHARPLYRLPVASTDVQLCRFLASVDSLGRRRWSLARLFLSRLIRDSSGLSRIRKVLGSYRIPKHVRQRAKRTFHGTGHLG